MTLKEKNIKIAEEVGISGANNFFKEFTEHPEYRGENFTWKKFPDISARLTKVSLFLSYRNKPRNLKELEEICYNICFKQSENLVKQYKL